jgi:hypothetical protein
VQHEVTYSTRYRWLVWSIAICTAVSLPTSVYQLVIKPMFCPHRKMV